MKTITFNTEEAKIIEKAICIEFGCSINEIVCFKNTFFKKVVVYFLVKIKGYKDRNVGLKYQITYLYIPTVINEIDYMIKVIPGFKTKITNVINIITNEKIMDCSAGRFVN